MDEGQIETKITDIGFGIGITQETDFSHDGGFTFEDITLWVHLNEKEAEDLIAKLRNYIVGIR